MTDELARCIGRLQDAGIRVALDDIGVRSPYLYHLLCLEPQFLKLDRLFVQGIDKDPRKQMLVDSMARMADRMGAQLIAEGIETAGEFEAMRALNVPMSQGYFLGRPQPAGQWQETECTGAA
jgi:EAL domain-containing protein (putative c-di-GMP-specific phosphodiesterase class I)